MLNSLNWYFFNFVNAMDQTELPGFSYDYQSLAKPKNMGESISKRGVRPREAISLLAYAAYLDTIFQKKVLTHDQ